MNGYNVALLQEGFQFVIWEYKERVNRKIRREGLVMPNGDPEGWIFLSHPHINTGFLF